MEHNHDLLVAAQRGDTTAFDILVLQHLAIVYGYLARRTSTATQAEDLTQETFIRAWKHIHQFDIARPLKPWLLRIARNALFDTLKRKQVTLEAMEQLELTASDDASPTELAQQAETKVLIQEKLQQLNPKEQEVLLLHYFDELSAKEIATVLETPLETVRTRLRRGRAALRDLFEPTFPSTSVVLGSDHSTSTSST